jgi:hypothetical protein
MDQLLEIMRQINKLSGVAVDALEQAGGKKGGGDRPAPEAPGENENPRSPGEGPGENENPAR